MEPWLVQERLRPRALAAALGAQRDAALRARVPAAGAPVLDTGACQLLHGSFVCGAANGGSRARQETLEAVRARHPALDLSEYQAAVGDAELGGMYGELEALRRRISEATAARL